MATQKLCIGAVVRVTRTRFKGAEREREYRIEQLVEIGGGATLYKIKSACEPFYRVVSEADLVTRY